MEVSGTDDDTDVARQVLGEASSSPGGVWNSPRDAAKRFDGILLSSPAVVDLAAVLGDPLPPPRDGKTYRRWLERWFDMDTYDQEILDVFFNQAIGLELPGDATLLKTSIWFPSAIGAETFWKELPSHLRTVEGHADLNILGFYGPEPEDWGAKIPQEFGTFDFSETTGMERVGVEFNGRRGDQTLVLIWKPGEQVILIANQGSARPKRRTYDELKTRFDLTDAVLIGLLQKAEIIE